jgi:hypothetical protein
MRTWLPGNSKARSLFNALFLKQKAYFSPKGAQYVLGQLLCSVLVLYTDDDSDAARGHNKVCVGLRDVWEPVQQP